MTPELVTYILTVSLGIVLGLALMAFWRNTYVRWLERKLATTRIELAQLKETRQQPWLQGATTEYHLQKKIEALRRLENACVRYYVGEITMEDGESLSVVVPKGKG